MCIQGDPPPQTVTGIGPRRIRLQRSADWRKPETAVSVTRPWRWGNPFVVGDIGYREDSSRHEYMVTSAATAVAMHRQWLGGREFVTGFDRPTLKEIHACLAGHDLCCWCPLDQACHGDTLLRLANTGTDEAVTLLAQWRAQGDSVLTRRSPSSASPPPRPPLSRVRSEKIGLLTAEEEVDLAKAIEAGLYADELLRLGSCPSGATAAELRCLVREGREAFGRFVAANVGLAQWQAGRRAGAGANGNLDVEDLTGEGILGVIRAVHKWDYTRGVKFSTYATPWIQNFQQRAVIRASVLTGSSDDSERIRELLAAQYRFAIDLGRLPTSTELAGYVGTTRRAVEETLAMVAAPRSLNEPYGDGAGTLGDVVVCAGIAGDDPAPTVAVPALLDCLTARERLVITEIFGLRDGAAASVADVATRHRIRVELVRRTAETALAKMRRAAGRAA